MQAHSACCLQSAATAEAISAAAVPEVFGGGQRERQVEGADKVLLQLPHLRKSHAEPLG